MTRTSIGTKFGGGLAQLTGTDLPTNRQIIQHSYFLQNIDTELNERNISKIVTKDLIPFWKKVNPRIPLIQELLI